MNKDYLLELSNKHKAKFSAILSTIRKYSKIAIFRHIHPDFDALGSANALKEFILTNYMDKEVKVLGDNHDELTPRLYPKTDTAHNSWFQEPFLAIVLDTPNKRRIADPRIFHAEYVIKIDHHPFIEEFADIELIDDEVSSTSELLANLLFSSTLKINNKCATYLYTGIVGDSGRFEYSTSPATLLIASKLLDLGVDLKDMYHRMYLHDQNDLKVIAYILNNYKVSKNGVAYFVLTRKELEQFHITTNQGKDHVNLFHFVDGIKIWCAITEDLKEECFRISLRSESIDISKVASDFRGGGHKNASGAKLLSLTELDDFIKALDSLI